VQGVDNVTIRRSYLAALALCVALPAWAHHSGAMFDQSRQMTLTGTVKEFQWTNPHSFIQLLVPGAGGVPDEWSVEMGPPPALYRLGWRVSSVKPGDRITVVINPMRDGSKGGNFLSGTAPDGQPLGKKKTEAGS
jgi:hypothetical protein